MCGPVMSETEQDSPAVPTGSFLAISHVPNDMHTAAMWGGVAKKSAA